MKVLFDEGVPKALRKHLPEYVVHTVQEQGWSSIQNGKLLQLVEQEKYELFITADKNMTHQQSLEGRSFAVLVLSTNPGRHFWTSCQSSRKPYTKPFRAEFRMSIAARLS